MYSRDSNRLIQIRGTIEVWIVSPNREICSCSGPAAFAPLRGRGSIPRSFKDESVLAKYLNCKLLRGPVALLGYLRDPQKLVLEPHGVDPRTWALDPRRRGYQSAQTTFERSLPQQCGLAADAGDSRSCRNLYSLVLIDVDPWPILRRADGPHGCNRNSLLVAKEAGLRWLSSDAKSDRQKIGWCPRFTSTEGRFSVRRVFLASLRSPDTLAVSSCMARMAKRTDFRRH